MNPKYSLNMQNKEDPMTRFRKIGRNVDFWPKMAIFLPKKGPKMAPIFLSEQKFSLTIFGPPQRGWDLWFSLRSSVCASVCAFGRDLKIRS